MSRGDTATMLVTGSTGAVGHEIVEQARCAGWSVIGCSRRGGPDAVRWDMTSATVPDELNGHWDVVVHTAARPQWNLPPNVAHSANVAPLSALRHVVGSRTRLVHLSTAFATGLTGSVRSTKLTDYRNSYEWSKAHAEREVLDTFDQVAIVRPPLVIGRRSDGFIAHHSGVYMLLRAAVTGMLPAFVGEPQAPAELVSSCDVAGAVLCALDAPGSCRTLGREETTLSVAETIGLFFAALNAWRAERGVPACPQPALVPTERWRRFMLPYISPLLTTRQRRGIDLLAEFIPYFSLSFPNDADDRVPSMTSAIGISVRSWAESFPKLAVRQPAPWTVE